MKRFATLVRTIMIAAFLLVSTGAPVFAVEPDEVLDDPVLEARARTLSKTLRCLVCQNENIDSSHAPLAKDLRVLLRERLVAGDTDEEVLEFLVARYGDFVLLQPPVQSNTLVLWLAPALFMIIGISGIIVFTRRTKHVAKETGLSADETKRLARLLDEE